MHQIDYPNALNHLIVAEFTSPGRLGIAITPIEPGLFRLLLWPTGLPDADIFRHSLLNFVGAEGKPQRVTMDLSDFRSASFRQWQWAFIETVPQSTPLADLARALFGEEHMLTGKINVHTQSQSGKTRCLAWSCHQPFATKGGRAVLNTDSLDILNWYSQQVTDFRPHVIWGAGDTAYSDGTTATNFVREVYDKGNWYTNPETRESLRREYRKMYRHYWSLEPLRKVLSSYPHLFIWDDHEIHDGWGSEGNDFQAGNFEMFRIAKDVAEEFILNAGPRVRPDGEESHQSYTQGSMAAFIFDTRSTRNYEAKTERLISAEQFSDFISFLTDVRDNPNITDLVTSTTVPFVGLRSWVTEIVTRVPDFINDYIDGVRDDVRDSWTSPGNLETLTEILGALSRFMHSRPDIRVVNISGDIHVAQAFEIHVPGAPAPIYQITTSAITNRSHPPELLAAAIELGRVDFLQGVGYVRRLWHTVTEPNILTMDFSNGRARYDLKVWNPESPGEKDLALHF